MDHKRLIRINTPVTDLTYIGQTTRERALVLVDSRRRRCAPSQVPGIESNTVLLTQQDEIATMCDPRLLRATHLNLQQRRTAFQNFTAAYVRYAMIATRFVNTMQRGEKHDAAAASEPKRFDFTKIKSEAAVVIIPSL